MYPSLRNQMGTLAAVALLLPVTLFPAGIVPSARFTRERIEITVRAESIEVDGLYEYENPLPFPWSQGMRVPFPVDPLQPPPAAVEVNVIDPASGKTAETLNVLWVGKEPHFSVRIPAFGTTHIRVHFSQYSPARSATYLLMTTRPWGRPLEFGEYILRTQGVQITGSNFPLEGPDCVCFTRRGFMPDRDWRFTWLAQ